METTYKLGWIFSSTTTKNEQYVQVDTSSSALYDVDGLESLAGITYDANLIYQVALDDTYIAQLYSRFTLLQQLAVFSGLLFSIKGMCASVNA